MEMMDKQAKIHIMGHRGIVGVTYILYYVDVEEKMLQVLRRLYISEEMKADDVCPAQNTQYIFHGGRSMPKYYETLLGREVKRDVKDGMALSGEME